MDQRQLRRILFLFAFHASAMPEAIAGPVNSPGSSPYAKASERGDRLTIGDLKGLVQWQEEGVERAGAFQWARAFGSTERFTGGIAEARDREDQAPAAIACAADETQLFFPERSAAYPAGRWASVDQNSTPVSGERRCAMLKTGVFAEYFPREQLLLINRTVRLSVALKNAELVAAGGSFLLLGSRQALTFFQQDARWQSSALWQHGFSNINPETRWEGNDRFLLKADPDGHALASLIATVDGPRTKPPERLPVNPCEPEQVCGLSLAQDDSWVLSGFWGHYLGRGQEFLRLDIPLSIGRGAGAVAFAHSASGGRFVYLGWDDGDQGQLPRLPEAPAERSRQSDRYMIWKRSADPLHHMQVWNGALPEPIPADWLAWEAEYSWDFPQQPTSRQAAADDRWWLDRLGALPAQRVFRDQGQALAPIHVAIIDSGIDPSHPLLQTQRAIKPGEIPDNGLDDDGNGFVDDVWGYDFVEEDAVPQDAFGHGSHVAGLLIGQSPRDLRNPAPNLLLTVVRALDRYGKSNSIDLARALLYAADNGVELINCSWGGGPNTQALRDAFAILKERGIVVFSSAGNDQLDTDQNPQVPKAYPGVWSVAASDRSDRLASFSSFGQRSVRFLAPGDGIVSAVPGGGLGEKSGTSMAAPLATASFALLWGAVRSLHPELSHAAQIDLTDRLLCSAADNSGVERRSQCGRLRLLESMRELLKKS